ncbi:hypothetical protein PsYK624_062150 [Phanerochaete sordida]|uniref:Uncharacterized protein n=1 Tax=Phanerochaete sordida TaxID=48140 RepID=A0A9P3G8N2_9APHY|nr:hypothetical protein PsYK624_062150 [Phanerochaete sordida]
MASPSSSTRPRVQTMVRQILDLPGAASSLRRIFARPRARPPRVFSHIMRTIATLRPTARRRRVLGPRAELRVLCGGRSLFESSRWRAFAYPDVIEAARRHFMCRPAKPSPTP